MPRAAVIDDDRDFLTYVTDALHEGGWEVVTCSDSLTAVGLVAREQPDAVLLDLRMESKNSGWELCTRLRLHPASREVPIIVCSADAQAMRSHAAWLQQNGMQALPKPFDLDDLYSALAVAARQAALARHAVSVSTA